MGSRRTSEYPHPAVTASALANEAAARGLRPPLQLTGPSGSTRGWLLVPADPDSLYADEFGDLIWGRPVAPDAVQVIRPCWPEEERSRASDIAHALEGLLTA